MADESAYVQHTNDIFSNFNMHMLLFFRLRHCFVNICDKCTSIFKLVIVAAGK